MRPEPPTGQTFFHSWWMSTRSCIGPILPAAIILLGISPAFSEPSDEERKEDIDFVEPIVTEEALPNNPGELSIRISTEYRQDSGRDIAVLPRLQFFYGLIDRLGIEIDLPFVFRQEESSNYGLGDISSSMKLICVRHGPQIPALVFGLEAGFPTGDVDRGLGEAAYELTPFLALLKDFDYFSVQGNVGWARQVAFSEHSSEEDLSATWVSNWALAVPLRERRFHFLVELNGEWSEDEPDTLSLAPGIKYCLTDEMFTAIAVPIGLNESSEDWGIINQFQFSF